MSNEVAISYSTDGGETFSAEIIRPLVGDDKEYLNRVVLNSLPAAYSMMFRIRYTGSTSFTLIEASANITPGI